MSTKWVIALAACLAVAIFMVGFFAGRGERIVDHVPTPVVILDTTIAHNLRHVQAQVMLLMDGLLYPKIDTIVVGPETIYIDSSTAFGHIPVRMLTLQDSFAVAYGGMRQLFKIQSRISYRGKLYDYELTIPKDFMFLPEQGRDVIDFHLALGVSVVPRVIPEAGAEVILLDRVGAYGRVEYDEGWKYRAGVKVCIEL